MTKFTVPTRGEVSENNQAIFDNLQKGLGFVPNLYAYYAKNETALGDYLALQNRKSTLKVKEREVINLVQWLWLLPSGAYCFRQNEWLYGRANY